jgi:hypothetical protein
MGYQPSGAYVKRFTTASPSTGAAADADALPVATAALAGGGTGAMALTVANVGVGLYEITGTVPAGRVRGDVLNVSVAATVGGVAGQAVVDTQVIETGDPWATTVPGAYATGTAGQIIGGLGYLSGGTLLAGPIDSNLKSVNGTTFTGASVPTASNVKKGQALNAFGFVMTDATTHLPAPGLTVAATRSLDGAAFAACANVPSGVASGAYKINLAAGDLNANVVILRFTAAGADDLLLTVVTQP